MAKYVSVKKGDLSTKIPDYAVERYLNKGWEKVEDKPVDKPKTYDSYTVKQLKDMASNRNIYISSKLRKAEIIDILIESDNHNAKKPTNKGFTDGLVIE